jgi:hypothetical protein
VAVNGSYNLKRAVVVFSVPLGLLNAHKNRQKKQNKLLVKLL